MHGLRSRPNLMQDLGIKILGAAGVTQKYSSGLIWVVLARLGFHFGLHGGGKKYASLLHQLGSEQNEH